MRYLFIVMLLIIASMTSAQLPDGFSKTSLGKCLLIDSLEKQAAQGDNYAMYLLADSYDTVFNKTFSPNYEVPTCGTHVSAIYWYTKAANNGEIGCMVNLAATYDHLRMFDSAYYWYVKAHQQNDNIGLLSLYKYSKLKLVSKEKRLNTKSLLKDIERLALTDVTLALKLALSYEYEGNGIKKNLTKAIYWYKIALRLGDAFSQYSIDRLEKERKKGI